MPRAGVRCGVGSNLGAASRGVNSTSACRAWSSAAGSWRSVARRPSEYVCLGAPGCPLRRDGPAACVVGPCAAFARGREAGLPRCWLQEGCTGRARRCDGQCCEPRMNLARTGGLLACRRVSGPHRTVSVESPRLRAAWNHRGCTLGKDCRAKGSHEVWSVRLRRMLTEQLYGKHAAALYAQAADFNKTARFYYMKAQDAYYLANAQASYDDWRRARRQWDYFYRRK